MLVESSSRRFLRNPGKVIYPASLGLPISPYNFSLLLDRLHMWSGWGTSPRRRGLPVSLNSIPVSLKSTPVSLKSTPVSLNSTPVSLNSTPVSLKGTPVSLNSTPVRLKRLFWWKYWRIEICEEVKQRKPKVRAWTPERAELYFSSNISRNIRLLVTLWERFWSRPFGHVHRDSHGKPTVPGLHMKARFFWLLVGGVPHHPGCPTVMWTCPKWVFCSP